ncbi:MAG TPA: hypothetical protein VGR07_15475 [Thermoanaerobaculia bacterium]|nr:hypothetical protein [Thermoanaerobaculia bacterium]
MVNVGVIYRCSGRDTANDAQMEEWKKKHSLVAALPSSLPEEIKALLGCIPDKKP